MPKVLTCVDFDSSTQTCLAQAWVDQSTWVNVLPTVEQANVVGIAFFASLFSVVAAKRLLKPQRNL